MTGPSFVIGDLPTFNSDDDRSFRITRFDGLLSVPAPRSELAANGSAGGSIPVGPWDDSEAYYNLAGMIHSTDRALLATYRKQLLAALLPTADRPIGILGNGEDADKQVWVRLYDAPTIDLVANNLIFSFPLVGPDPLKYGLAEMTGTMGVFTGSQWFNTFTLDATPDPDVWHHAFELDATPNPDVWFATFEQAQQSPTAPPFVRLTSDGDAVSRRLVVSVTGPVTAGDWKLVNETTGDELWADLTLSAGQTVVFDCHLQTATLNTASVDDLVYGDFLTIEPGDNVYRLVSGTASDGFAEISGAYPAYK